MGNPIAVVMVELAVIAGMRDRGLDTPLLSAVFEEGGRLFSLPVY